MIRVANAPRTEIVLLLCIGGNSMRLDEKSPFFRRVIVPLYDSETACLVTIIVMTALFWFGILGIWVAREGETYFIWEYLWVPICISGLSFVVIATITIRLIKRFAFRFTKSN